MSGPLALLLGLYVRPAVTMGKILDEGRLLFAAVGAAVTVGLMASGSHVVAPGWSTLAIAMAIGVPVSMVVLIWWESMGGVGTVLMRDFVPVLVCTLMAVTAAGLPAALLLMTPMGHEVRIAAVILAAAGVYYWWLCAAALRTVMGATWVQSFVATACGWLACVGASAALVMFGNVAYYLTSPWVLYFLYMTFSGDIQAAGFGLRARQHMRRQLEFAAVNPRDADAQYQLGLIYLGRRQTTMAEAHFRKAIEIDPKEPDALFHLGILMREKGRAEEAVGYLERVRAIDEKHSLNEVWRELGAAYFTAGRAAEAKGALETYTSRREYDPEGFYWLGMALKKLGDAAGAKKQFKEAIETAKTAPPHLRGRAKRWARMAKTQV